MKQTLPNGTDTREIRITRLTVVPPGKTILDDAATHIEIDDEGGGEFISVRQNDCRMANVVRFCFDEWPVLRDAIDFMVKEVRVEQ